MHSPPSMLRQLYEQQQACRPEDINDGRVYGPDLDYEEADERPGPSAWIDGEWKLHRRAGDHLLFHLGDDEGEQNNLIDRHPERAEQMRIELHQWEESVIRSMRGEDY